MRVLMAMDGQVYDASGYHAEPMSNTLPNIPRWVIIGTLWVWFAVVLVTHYGQNSPYSYASAVVGITAARIDGLVVNRDSLSVQPVTMFFYDASPLDLLKAHNLKLPMHSALTAATASYLRSYMLSNYLVNLLCLWLLSYAAVIVADSFALPRAATFIAALTCAALPSFAHFAGQPMHYIVGITVNFLVLLAAIVMARDGVRSPIRCGLLIAILLTGYDPYVFAAALAAWLVFVLRFRLRELPLCALAAAIPFGAWRLFLRALSAGQTLSPDLKRQIIGVPRGWWVLLTHLNERQMEPFIAGHVGLELAGRMGLALVYWPVWLVLLAGLFFLHRELHPTSTTWLVSALALLFVAEQLVVVAFDGENNPRRAFALMFAACAGYFYVVSRFVDRQAWRIGFTVVLLISMFVTMSDRLTRIPVVGYMHTGEAMRERPKNAFDVADSFLNTDLLPKLVFDDPHPHWWSLGSAHVARPLTFLFANLFAGALFYALLHILRERKLLPRYLPIAFGILYVASLGIRFIAV